MDDAPGTRWQGGWPARAMLVLVLEQGMAWGHSAPASAQASPPSGTLADADAAARFPPAGESFVADTILPLARPGYLAPLREPSTGYWIIRVTGDSGVALGVVAGRWGRAARHVYSVQQPWSSDGSLLLVRNVDGSPSPLFLDGETYAPRPPPCSDFDPYDFRWHPSPAHPHELVDVDRAGTTLSWYDVTTCTQTRRWSLPIASSYGIGSGAGNPSRDGRFVAVGNDTEVVVVDMDPQPPFAPYPERRIGPVCHLPPESLLVSSPGDWSLGNLSVSPSGRYLVLKFAGSTDTTADMYRVFEVDPATLALRPHPMDASALRCGSFAARPNGWIFPLKHADMTLDPFDNDEDVLVGGRSCPGSTLGRLVKVRLRDGRVTALTDPTDEAPISHCSARNLDRPGWVYASYYRERGNRSGDEIVAVRLDGSRAEHLAHTHTDPTDCYLCEAQPVPSPDGRRVLFASNWAQDCGPGCGSRTQVCDFIATAGPLPGEQDRVTVEQVLPNPSRSPPTVVYSLAHSGEVHAVLVDVAGRVRSRRPLGWQFPGRHATTLDRTETVPPGVYWVRIVQDGQAASSPVVVLR